MTSSYYFTNQLRFHYQHWNLGNGSRPVVLLHGLASNCHIWDRVAPYLVEAGLEIYAPDLRGHGLTDKPDGDYGFQTYQQDLLGLMQTLDIERPLLVGHSWGAMVALDYAAQFAIGPLAPAGLVLVDGGFIQLNEVPGATWESTRQRLEPPRLAGMQLDDFLARMRNHHQKWTPDDEAEQIILNNFEIREDDSIAPHLSHEHHMLIVRAMWEFDTYSRFQRVRCPALLVPARSGEPLSPGERDFLSLKENGIHQIQQNNPAIQVHWMENSVHDIPLQHPDKLANVLTSFFKAIPSQLFRR